MASLPLNNPNFKNGWDLLIVAITALLTVYIPLKFALGTQYSHNAWFAIFVSIIFFTDLIWLSYRYEDEFGAYYSTSGKARPLYLRSWFVVNLLAAIPFVLFSPASLLAIRLFKLARAGKILDTWRTKKLQYSNQLALLYLIIAIVIIVHWITCGWMVIHEVSGPLTDVASKYLDALYWSVTTITTVGYGDITPVTRLEKAYAIFAMLMGLGFYGFLIGNITRLLAKKDPAREHFLDNIDKLSMVVRYRSLPSSLQHRIYDYYNFKWQKRLGFDESDFLAGLPNSLKMRVALHLKKDILENIPMFRHASPEFIESIALHLKPVVFTPEDYIFKAGETGEEMFFIIQGKVKVVAQDGKNVLSRLSDGDCFGEVALFHSKPRTASIIAEDYCDLYSLSKAPFDEVIKQYPGFADKIEAIVLKREKNLGKEPND